MNHVDLLKAREKYEELKKQNKIIEKKKKRYQDLLKEPLIQEFLSLTEETKQKLLTEKEMLRRCFPIGTNTIDECFTTNGIWINFGCWFCNRNMKMYIFDYFLIENS